MGVSHKVKPEVRDFILETQKQNLAIGCRKIVGLVEEKFKVKVSKSTVNYLIKNSGLSMPLGRRRIHRRRTERIIQALAEASEAMVIPPEPPAKESAPPQPEKPAVESIKTAPEILHLPLSEEKKLLSEEAKAPIQAPAPPVKEIEPVKQEAKPPTEEIKPPIPIEETPQPVEDVHPPAEEIKPPVEEIKPVEEETKPTEKETEPSEEKIAAPVEEIKPSVEEIIPTSVKEPELPALETPKEQKPPEPQEPVIPVVPKEPEEKPQPPVKEEVTPPAKPKAPVLSHAEKIKIGDVESCGAIILKAADILTGGTFYISEVIKNRFQFPSEDLLSKIEALLYAPLFNLDFTSPIKSDSPLWSLLNCRLGHEDIAAYLSTLKELKVLNSEIFQTITNTLQDVRGIQVSLSDGSVFYLDGQSHAIWSAQQVPYDFSGTIHNLKIKFDALLQGTSPWIVLAAPGYDSPTKEVFDFISGLEGNEKNINKVSFYGQKFEELDLVRIQEAKKQKFIFGLWPWQFTRFRTVRLSGEYRPFASQVLKREIFLVEAMITLSQPTLNKTANLRACALKLQPMEKAKLVLITNLNEGERNSIALADEYLSAWPNPEEAFENFSRRVELFTYTANTQQYFSLDSLPAKRDAFNDIQNLFNYYLNALDLYTRWHFLPTGFENKDFMFMKTNFYGLKVKLTEEKNTIRATFQLPAEYAYVKELKYLCRRLNERGVELFAGQRVWFGV